jgi:hypothetical protein
MKAYRFHSLRAYAGGLALALGCLGIFITILLLPLSLFGHSFWIGFSPDGPGMPAAARQAAISQAVHDDLIYRFVPLFFGSLTLICYGFYEAREERRHRGSGSRGHRMGFVRAFTMPMYVAALMLCIDARAADSPRSVVQTNHPGIEAYFRWNGLTNSAALRVGMKLEDAIKLLGKPTSHVRDGRLVPGQPQYPFEGWLRWYHNPRDVHVAPSIRLRIEEALVKQVQAGRG